MIRVNGLYLRLKGNRTPIEKLHPVIFVDFSLLRPSETLSAWDKEQKGIYYIILNGQLQAYSLGENAKLVSDHDLKDFELALPIQKRPEKTSKSWWQKIFNPKG